MNDKTECFTHFVSLPRCQHAHILINHCRNKITIGQLVDVLMTRDLLKEVKMTRAWLSKVETTMEGIMRPQTTRECLMKVEIDRVLVMEEETVRARVTIEEIIMFQPILPVQMRSRGTSRL